MLGLLKKILPQKQKNRQLSERDLNGRDHVGYPTLQLSREIDDLVKKKYSSIKPIIKLYKETLFFKWGPNIINNALTDEQLANLSGRNVQMVYLLLFRDMLRHVSKIVTPKYATENWSELFAQEILDACKMLSDTDDNDITIKQQLFASNELFTVDTPIDDQNPENTEIPAWAAPIAELIMLPPDMIYKCHRPLMTVILEKLKKNKKK
ncbi:hypothetical protein [Gilliamella sp. wkB112]|uniref:hypothetical protein n=1 Tax=Gilliamella sp. wkB112 TaxID=3120257 RepID=UPI00080DD6C5|nr:hypothetical protein [Gilliamella apicola]OCG01288.1 hypothetical protein A9G12_01670 [Gilliamella apicola]